MNLLFNLVISLIEIIYMKLIHVYISSQRVSLHFNIREANEAQKRNILKKRYSTRYGNRKMFATKGRYRRGKSLRHMTRLEGNFCANSAWDGRKCRVSLKETQILFHISTMQRNAT